MSLETLKDRVVRWINNCASNTEIEDVKDALEKGEMAMQAAEGISTFTNQHAGVVGVFSQAREGFGTIRETLNAVHGRCLDLRAVNQIHAAIGVLNQDGVIQRNPEAAARAFGLLFVGLGQLATHLPPPADQYAQILLNCGDFFENMRQKLNPVERYRNREDWRSVL
jgi:hypothetical protein